MRGPRASSSCVRVGCLSGASASVCVFVRLPRAPTKHLLRSRGGAWCGMSRLDDATNIKRHKPDDNMGMAQATTSDRGGDASYPSSGEYATNGGKNNRMRLNELGHQKKCKAEYEYKVDQTDNKFMCTVTMLQQTASGELFPTKNEAAESAATALVAKLTEQGMFDLREGGQGGRAAKDFDPNCWLKNEGALVVIDLDNSPFAIRIIDDFMSMNDDHDVCEGSAYCSKVYHGGELPAYANLHRAESMDKDAADILMVFDTALRLVDLVTRRNLKRVIIVSRDHFAARLKEILLGYRISCTHAGGADDLKAQLEQGVWRGRR